MLCKEINSLKTIIKAMLEGVFSILAQNVFLLCGLDVHGF
jgi:hypothetical protein